MTTNNNLSIFSPDSDPYGLSYPEWAAKWWQWALSIPVDNNPVTDTTGEKCAVNQNGPVWYLAGTLGGLTDRSCTIPAEKAILLPILNHGGTLGDSQSEEELVEYTKKEMDFGIKLDAMIDNMKLSGLNRYRVLSPIFDVVLSEKNLFGGRPGPTRGVSDGYWLFLQPLHQGKHTIRTFGSCLAGKIRIGVNYDITSI